MILSHNIRILKRNSDYIVFYKPAGIACELSNDIKGSSLISIAEKELELPARLKLPHRIDRITNGIVVTALSDMAIEFFGKEIRERTWDKYYLAKVTNPFGKDAEELSGLHKCYLKEKGHRTEVVHSGGAPSLFEIIASAPSPEEKDVFHLFIRLLTGRKHQIRVMLQHLGFPMAGDPFYGYNKKSHTFYLEHIMLRYREPRTLEYSTIYEADLADRIKIAPELQKIISEQAALKPL